MTQTVPNASQWFRRWTLLVVLSIACLVALYFGYPYFRDSTTDILEWIEGLGPWAPVAFIAIVVVAILLLVPGLLLSLGAGFMFGVVKGVVCMWIATNLGAAIAFLIGRYFMGDRFAHFVRSHEKTQRLNNVLKNEGWRVVMLTRMVPFFPFKLSNYVFGFAGFSLWHFCVGTALGIVPITVFNVYTGSLAGDLATLGQTESQRTPLEWTFRIALFVVSGFFFLYVTHVARKALRTSE